MDYYELTPASSFHYTEFTLNSTSQSIFLTDINHPISYGPDLTFNNGYTEHVSLISNLFCEQDAIFDLPNMVTQLDRTPIVHLESHIFSAQQGQSLSTQILSNVQSERPPIVQSQGQILPCQGLPIVLTKGQTWSSQSGGQILLSPQCSVQNNLNGLSDSSCLKPCANPSLTPSHLNVNNTGTFSQDLEINMIFVNCLRGKLYYFQKLF